MSQTQVVSISLSPQESKWVQKGLASGKFASPNQVIHEGLRRLFQSVDGGRKSKRRSTSNSSLENAYKKSAARDRKMAAEWSDLKEAWPED